MLKTLAAAFTSLVVGCLAFAASPEPGTGSTLYGWAVGSGALETGGARSANPLAPVELRTTELQALPLEATFRFRAAQGDAVTFSLTEEAQVTKETKPLLTCSFRPSAATAAHVTA